MIEFEVVSEDEVDEALRLQLAGLLSRILDDGPRYIPTAWRTLEPRLRAVALEDGSVVGQASLVAVRTRPEIGLMGLGDVAVAEPHRRRGIARMLCAMATDEARWLHAGAVLAKTRPLRGVLGDLGYEPVDDSDYYYRDRDGACVHHPDWMAVRFRAHPRPVWLAEGDF